MRRKAIFVMILILLAGLTACGGKEETEPFHGVVYVPEDVSFQWGLQRILSGCVAGENVFLAGYADNGEIQLQRLPLSGGEGEPLPDYQPARTSGQIFPMGARMWAGTDGTLWLRETMSVNTVDENGVFAGNEDLLVLRQLDADGGELSRFEAKQEELESQIGLGAVSDLVMDGDGDVYVQAEQGVALLDRSGEVRFTLETERDYGRSLILLGDGRVGCSDTETGEEVLSCLRTVDKEAEAWGETYPLSISDTAVVYGGDENALFYYRVGDALWAWREAGEENDEGGEMLMSFLDAGIDVNSVNFLTFLPDGRLAVMCGQLWEERSAAKLNVLTPTEASALPDKKVLTYAAFYLGSRERAAILDFNRTNTEYMISVTDYSQYGSLTDISGGLTKLTTEIGAGHIPDIMALWYMPVAQWGAKGLLEDLWPYIDNDPELGRENLMARVLEASEIDGKLYEISDSFRFYTLTGAKSVVGDRFTWTPEDMWEALEKMPDGCIPLRDGGKSDVLLDMMALDWDRFVDWERGTCRFDSEEFQEVLEFCNSFPDAGVQATGIMDEQTRLLDRQQMLMNWHITSLDSIQEYRFLLGDDVAFVGYPNPWGEVGSSFYLDSGLAMSSSCKDKDAAWSFMRRLLLPHEEIDGSTFFSFPVNKADFEAEMKRQMTPLLDIDGNEITFTSPVYVDGAELEREQRAAVQDDLDLIMALYNAVDTVYRWDSALGDIITDVAGAYFAGDKSLEETAELIQRRAALYVSEQK